MQMKSAHRRVECGRASTGRDDADPPADQRFGRSDYLNGHNDPRLTWPKGGILITVTFESDPAKVDDAISMVRAEVESGETPPGLEGAKMLMLVNRETGKGLGITLFESEEAMQRGDEALNAMNPGGTERRTSVEFYEVPVQTVS
jgi:hypothetical protein